VRRNLSLKRKGAEARPRRCERELLRRNVNNLGRRPLSKRLEEVREIGRPLPRGWPTVFLQGLRRNVHSLAHFQITEDRVEGLVTGGEPQAPIRSRLGRTEAAEEEKEIALTNGLITWIQGTHKPRVVKTINLQVGIEYERPAAS